MNPEPVTVTAVELPGASSVGSMLAAASIAGGLVSDQQSLPVMLGAIGFGLPAPVDSVSGEAGSDAVLPGWADWLGGRQSARSIHFVTCAAIGGFVVVHLALVILAGAGNELRSMITGRWKVPKS